MALDLRQFLTPPPATPPPSAAPGAPARPAPAAPAPAPAATLDLRTFLQAPPPPRGPRRRAPTPAGLNPRLAEFAGLRQINGLNFVVTSTTGGRHNVGSLHPRGLAMDVVPLNDQQWDELIRAFQSQGFRVLDERQRPSGQEVWSGAHLHIEVTPGQQQPAARPSQATPPRAPVAPTRPAAARAPVRSTRPESGVVIESNGRYYVVRQDDVRRKLTPQQLVTRKVAGPFPTVAEAERASRARSEELGRQAEAIPSRPSFAQQVAAAGQRRVRQERVATQRQQAEANERFERLAKAVSQRARVPIDRARRELAKSLMLGYASTPELRPQPGLIERIKERFGATVRGIDEAVGDVIRAEARGEPLDRFVGQLLPRARVVLGVAEAAYGPATAVGEVVVTPKIRQLAQRAGLKPANVDTLGTAAQFITENALDPVNLALFGASLRTRLLRRAVQLAGRGLAEEEALARASRELAAATTGKEGAAARRIATFAEHQRVRPRVPEVAPRPRPTLPAEPAPVQAELRPPVAPLRPTPPPRAAVPVERPPAAPAAPPLRATEPIAPPGLAVRSSSGASFTAEELQTRAAARAPEFTQRLQAVAARTGTRFGPDVMPQLADTTVKSLRSIQIKAMRGEMIDDALRQTIIIPHPEAAPHAIDDVLRGLEEDGFQLLNVRNRFTFPERGYKDVNIKLAFPDDPGMIAELQLITPRVLQQKMLFGHDLYDVSSKLVEQIRLEMGEHPALGQIAALTDRAMQEIYEDALRLDLADSTAVAMSGRRSSMISPTLPSAAVKSEAAAGEIPAISSARGLPVNQRAAISARREISGLPSQVAAIERPTPSVPAPALRGKVARASTARGTSIETEFAVVDARDLISSHDVALRPDPRFPPELQPRMRERAASEAQITSFLEHLSPDSLGESARVSRGAPIVGDDLVVESGNARTIGLKRAYQTNHPNAEAYRAWLQANADRFGVDAAQLRTIEQPVLVRIRRTPVDRVRFAMEANEGTRAAMSAVEVARADAGAISDDLMGLFEPSETGEILTPGNREFVRAFLRDVVSPGDQGRMLTSSGALSQEGITRIRNAIFAKAYGDIAAIEKLAEATDVNVRNIITGMLRAAPRLASIKTKIAQGALHNLDLTGDIAAAMNKLSNLRDEGIPVDIYLAQQPLFGEELTPEARTLLELFSTARSQKRVSEILTRYADLVEAAGNPRQVGLLGEATPPTKTQLLGQAARAAPEPQLGLPLEAPRPATQPPAVAVERAVPTPPTVPPAQTAPGAIQRAARPKKVAPARATAEDLATLDEFAALQRSNREAATGIRRAVDEAMAEYRAAHKVPEPRTRAEVQRVADRAYGLAMARNRAVKPQSWFRRFVAAEILEPQGFGASPKIAAATAQNLRDVGGGVAEGGFIRIPRAPAAPGGMPPDVARALAIGRPGVRDRMVQSWQRTKQALTNYFTFEGQLIGVRTPGRSSWQEVRDDFRLFHDVPRIDVPRRVVDDIAGVVGDLSADDYHTFADYVVLRDWQEELRIATREGRTASVPFGLSDYDLAAALRDADDRLNDRIRGAVTRYDRLKAAQRDEFVRRGYGDPESFRQYHFRHYVLDYDELYGGTIGLPRGRLREPFRTYLRARKGSTKPVLTDPIDVLNKEFSRFYLDNAVDDFFEEIRPKVDWLPTLSKEERIRAFGPSGRPTRAGQLVTLEDGMRLITWQYHPGNRVFPAYTLAGRLTEGATTRTLTAEELRTIIESVEDPELVKAARQMLVLGQKWPMILIDPKLSPRLNQFVSGSAADRMFRHVEGLTGVWKRGLIDSLGLPFQMQNFIGDMENGMVIGGHLPTTSLGRATAVLVKRELGLALQPAETAVLETAERLRVVRSGFTGAFLKRNPRLDARLRHLLPPAERIARAPEQLLGVYERAAGVREDAVRLAHFWDNLDRIHRGEQIRMSAAIDVSGLLPERAAAKVAREAFIDYGGRSPFEDQFRSVLAPFVTWFYQNTRNWVRLAVRDPAQLLVKAVPLYAGMTVWNNTGDRVAIESGLPKWRRAMPHIITGWELSDGRPLIVSLQTAGGAAAQALGLTRLFESAQRVARGEISLEAAARKLPADMGEEAIRGIAFALGPGVTVPVESLIYGVTAAAGKPVALDIRRGVPRIPERLRGTAAGLRQFLGEEARTVFPPAEIALRQREPGRVVPPGTSPAIRAGMATGLLKPVDLATEQRGRGIEAAETAEAALEDKLYRIEQAFITGGRKAAVDVLRTVNRETGPKIRAGDFQRRLTSTRVQLDRVREQLRAATTEEEVRRLRQRLEGLLKRAGLERFKQVPKPARPFARPQVPVP